MTFVLVRQNKRVTWSSPLHIATRLKGLSKGALNSYAELAKITSKLMSTARGGEYFFLLLFKTFKWLHNSKHSTKPWCTLSRLEALLQFLQEGGGEVYNNVPISFAALCNKTQCDTPANGTGLFFFFLTTAAIFLSIINCCSLQAFHQHRHSLFFQRLDLYSTSRNVWN